METKNTKETEKKTRIPVSIRWISWSLFLFMMGRGLGGDTFFSVYVKSIIGAGIGISLIGTLLALTKLLVVIPVGVMNDQGNTRYLLILGKILYAVCGVFYFLAGVEYSARLLIIAVTINGIASSTMFTTYRTVYGKKGQRGNGSKVFGVYFSSINMAYFVGALLSAICVYYIDLPYMYLFIVIFSMLSLVQDHKIQKSIDRRFKKTWNNLEITTENIDYEIEQDIKDVKKVLGKKGVLATFLKEILSIKPWKNMFDTLKSYGGPMYVSLAAQAIVSFMNYVGFLFVPIVAIEANLTLSQIAILFAVMRLPYIINIFVGNLGDKFSKKILITVFMLISSVVYILFGIYDSFIAIVILSFLSSLMIALLSPITSALTTGYARPKDKGILSGIQELVNRCGEIIGSLGFGILASFIGMKISFVALGLALGVLSTYLLSKKITNRKNRDNESKKEILAKTPLFRR